MPPPLQRREAGKRLLADATAGEHIIVTKGDRLFRSAKNALEIAEVPHGTYGVRRCDRHRRWSGWRRPPRPWSTPMISRTLRRCGDWHAVSGTGLLESSRLGYVH